LYKYLRQRKPPSINTAYTPRHARTLAHTVAGESIFSACSSVSTGPTAVTARVLPLKKSSRMAAKPYLRLDRYWRPRMCELMTG
jgi:hypothetical protein